MLVGRESGAVLVAGDDCCHVVRKEFAGREYEALAGIYKDLLTEHDPYHVSKHTQVGC